MTKEVDEKFFDEVSRAIEKQDTEALNTLMGPVDDEEIKKEPNQEVTAEEDEAEVTETDDSPDNKESSDEPNSREEDVEEDNADSEEVAKLKKELEEARTAQHRLKSDAGRVPGLQRKLAELDKRLQEMAEKSAKTTDEDGDSDASLQDAFKNEHFELIKETDPTLAAALQAILGDAFRASKKESVQAAREVTNTFREVEEEEALRTEWDKLVEVAPEAPEIFKSPEWSQYKNTLTPAQRALAESGFADDVLVAIERYNRFIGKEETVKQTAHVTEERERKLKTKTPGSHSVSPAKREADDPNALFHSIYEELRKQGQHTR